MKWNRHFYQLIKKHLGNHSRRSPNSSLFHQTFTNKNGMQIKCVCVQKAVPMLSGSLCDRPKSKSHNIYEFREKQNLSTVGKKLRCPGPLDRRTTSRFTTGRGTTSWGTTRVLREGPGGVLRARIHLIYHLVMH
jgi:hypothetical protein